MEKIRDIFSDMPCHPFNQTTQPTHYFFELFRSKHLEEAKISSIDRLTCIFINIPPQWNASRRVCKNLFLHFYFIKYNSKRFLKPGSLNFNSYQISIVSRDIAAITIWHSKIWHWEKLTSIFYWFWGCCNFVKWNFERGEYCDFGDFGGWCDFFNWEGFNR